MNKTVLFFCILFVNISFSQNYFEPKIGGLQSVVDGEKFYKVEIKDKTQKEIYEGLLALVKDVFTGEEDEILETVDGESIKAKGVIRNFICSKEFDVFFEVEFKVKDGRYIFMFNKYNILANEDGWPIVFQAGSNVLSGMNKKTYMFNKKGKVGMSKRCYKEIVSSLDILGGMFDISDDFSKYEILSKKTESGW